MKKYFLRETGNEVKFGDMLELDLVEEAGGHKLHHHIECKFVPELIPLLREYNFLDVRRVKEKSKEEKGENNEAMNEFPYNFNSDEKPKGRMVFGLLIKLLKQMTAVLLNVEERLDKMDEKLEKFEQSKKAEK